MIVTLILVGYNMRRRCNDHGKRRMCFSAWLVPLWDMYVFLMCISFNILYRWVLKAQGLKAKKMGLSFIFHCAYICLLHFIYYMFSLEVFSFFIFCMMKTKRKWGIMSLEKVLKLSFYTDATGWLILTEGMDGLDFSWIKMKNEKGKCLGVSWIVGTDHLNAYKFKVERKMIWKVSRFKGCIQSYCTLFFNVLKRYVFIIWFNA